MAKKHKFQLSKQDTESQKTYVSNWQIITAVALVFITLIAVSALWPKSTVPADFVPQVEGAPSIAVISEPVIDHGDLVVNIPVTSTFEIQNVGDETLFILGEPVRVHEGCCPPQAIISTKRLRPGEIATVSMTYTMHPGMDGPHDLRIHLLTNDPENPEFELTALSNWGRG